ncbi:flagellar biosynthetic protein FliO [Coralloluteibacterium stylophorae]|uniref:Flagellar protein n=1 Tax=Coralloluteibacterium stylophorae TaxID=1776034 RepID=A0A8J8AZM4_9GAMM|nr:flagellar biosynthetic protein FliO [Coralloluteibacterium stylophorae]
MSTAAAAGAAAGKAGVGTAVAAGPGIAGGLFALLLVVGLILGLAWLLKRMPGSGFRQAPGLRMVAALQVGAKERLVVVEAGGEQILVGVTPAGIRSLHTLREPIAEAAPAAQAGFAMLLRQHLKK